MNAQFEFGYKSASPMAPYLLLVSNNPSSENHVRKVILQVQRKKERNGDKGMKERKIYYRGEKNCKAMGRLMQICH